MYILFSEKDKRLYIGQTSDLEKRLKAHNSGKVKSTRNRKPLRLIYHESCASRESAIQRERELKSISSRDFKRT